MSHLPAAQQANEQQQPQQQMVAALAAANGPIAVPQPVGFRLVRLLHWDAAAGDPLCSLRLEHEGASYSPQTVAALAYLRQEQRPLLRVFRHSETGEERVPCSDLLATFGVKDSGYQWNDKFPGATLTRIVGAQSVRTISLADFALYVAWVHNRLEELQGPEAQELLAYAQTPANHRSSFRKNTPAAVMGRAFVQAALNALLGLGAQPVQVTHFEGGGFVGAAAVVGAAAMAAAAAPAAPAPAPEQPPAAVASDASSSGSSSS